MKIQIRSKKSDVEGSTVDVEYLNVAGFSVLHGIKPDSDDTVMIYIEGWRKEPVPHKYRGDEK